MSRVFYSARLLLIVGALFGMAKFLGAPPAFAAGIVGNGTPASCTETALDNALSGGGLVTFNCGANPKTITITTRKQIAVNTTVDGGNKITLKAQNTYHFQVFYGVTFALKNITLRNSNVAALENFGASILTNVTFKDNVGVGSTNGGAIYNLGTLKVKNSSFRNNRAENGGAIYNDGGTVSIRLSTFVGNQAVYVTGTPYGGAVNNHNGTMTIKGSTFLDNQAGEGGALHTDYGTTNTIKKSTFDNNQAADCGGGIDNLGNTTIAASVIRNNTAGNCGGGISHGGTLTMQTTTVSGNHASSGAGMRDFGNSTTVLTSTFSGNVSTGDGGGIYSSTNTVLRDSTLSGNQAALGRGGGGYFQNGGNSGFLFVTIANNKAGFAGGIYSESAGGGSIQIENVLLSKNQNGNCGGATLISLGGNISSDTYCSTFTQSHDRQNVKAKISTLGNYGGPTQTHMLLAGSPAINNALNLLGLTKDQRGMPRPKGGAPDTGAVEAQ